MAEATKVGSIFYESKIDSSGVKKGAEEISGHLDKLKSNFNSLNPTVRALGLSLGAVVAGGTIVDFFKQSISAANEANRVMAQTNAVIQSTGGVAGYTATEIQRMASEIQKTTTIGDEAAQMGMNMLLTFTKIGNEVFPEATQAMIDMATAMNGGVTPTGEELSQTAIQLGKALNDPILGVTALRRVGVNFNETQGEMIRKMVESGNIMEAQKYILRELSTEFGGSAKAQAQTFEGQMLQLNNSISDFKELVGKSMIPALSYLVSSLSGAAGGFNALLFPIRAVASAVVGLIMLVRQLGMILNAVLATGLALFTGQADLIGGIWEDTAVNMVTDMADAQQKLTQIWSDETDEQVGIFEGGMQDMMDASGGKSAKIKKDLEDETQKYQEETAKRKRRFIDNLADMIWAHQDKVKSLKQDLEEENADFNKRMADRKATFKETMQEMRDDHNETIKELNADLSEETDEHEKKTSEIQALIDKEESYGKNARQSKIIAWKEQLAEEVASFEEKTLKLQEKIDAENLKYDEQVAKAKARDEAETLRLQEEHAKRTSDIETNLKAEEEILARHSDSVALIKDKEREDDIARLIRQHEEENIEAERQHQKRMVDIVSQGSAQGAAGGGAFKTEMDKKLEETKKSMDEKTKQMGKDMVKNLSDSAKEAGKELVKNFINALIDKANEAKGFMGGVLTGLPGIGPVIGAWASLPKLASGANNFRGGMALVGEQGPELVRLPKGADVIPADRTRDMLESQIININNPIIADNLDIESVAREIGFKTSLRPR